MNHYSSLLPAESMTWFVPSSFFPVFHRAGGAPPPGSISRCLEPVMESNQASEKHKRSSKVCDCQSARKGVYFFLSSLPKGARWNDSGVVALTNSHSSELRCSWCWFFAFVAAVSPGRPVSSLKDTLLTFLSLILIAQILYTLHFDVKISVRNLRSVSAKWYWWDCRTRGVNYARGCTNKEAVVWNFEMALVALLCWSGIFVSREQMKTASRVIPWKVHGCLIFETYTVFTREYSTVESLHQSFCILGPSHRREIRTKRKGFEFLYIPRACEIWVLGLAEEDRWGEMGHEVDSFR
jgi:hypothetical protein